MQRAPRFSSNANFTFSVSVFLSLLYCFAQLAHPARRPLDTLQTALYKHLFAVSVFVSRLRSYPGPSICSLVFLPQIMQDADTDLVVAMLLTCIRQDHHAHGRHIVFLCSLACLPVNLASA